MSLTEARKTYKPFEYPWAYEYWKRQQQVHWMPEEVPLGEDCRDWAGVDGAVICPGAVDLSASWKQEQKQAPLLL